MKNNYKNAIIALTLSLLTLSAQGATLANGATSVWFDLNRISGDPTNYAVGSGTISRALAAQISADTPTFWNTGEPNDSSGEDCATQVANGSWNDLACNQTRRVACFNGTNWSLTAGTVAMGANNNASEVITNPTNACQALAPAGSWHFAAPTTLAQRNALTSLITAANITNGVWINAQDMRFEGVWAINRGVPATLMAPFWNAGEPNNSGGNEHCAEVLNTGLWNDLNCATNRPLVCANTDLTAWQILNTPVAFTEVDALHQMCQQAFGLTWNFAAPRTLAERNALSTAMSSAGITGAWINARDNVVEGYWMLNHGLMNWAAGEPDFNRGICTTARQNDGRWLAANCDSRAKIMCSNGINWVIRNADHQFSNQALEACSRPDSDTGTNNFVGYTLRAPRTEHERSLVTRLIQAQGNGTQVWLNLKRIQDTGVWLWNEGYDKPDTSGSNLSSVVWYDLVADNGRDFYSGPWRRYSDGANLNVDQALLENKGVRAYFAEGEPNDSGGCVQLYTSGGNAGLWDDTNCATNLRVACFDGFDWAISPGTANQGNNSEVAGDLNAAHNACAAVTKNGVAGNYRFAAPLSFAQSQELLTVARQSGTGNVWININDKRYNRTFVYNLGAQVIAPFWNAGEPNNAGGNEDCAVQQRTTGLWNDLPCSSSQRLACYNPYNGANGSWSITPTSHTFTTPSALSLVCEQAFGGQYKFFAPVTLSQRNDLVAAMTAVSVDNVYINANDQESEGTWRLNVDINNWAAGQPSANTNERCVAASVTDSQWRARNCADSLPVACTTGGRWYFTDSSVNLNNFANGQQACSALGNGYLFNAPRSLDDAQQMQYFAQLAGVGGNFWINGNRLENFAAWEWNQRSLQTPIWSSDQPNGGSRENCAVLNNNVEATWADERCDSATDRAYLCRNGNNWQVSSIQGSLEDFSQAVSACAALGAGWVFAAPATYNENLLAKNAMGATAQVWVNATDAMKEGTWVLNAAPISTYPNWAAGQPDNGGLLAADESAILRGEDCVYQDNTGRWFDTACTAATEYSWACTDGYVWKVTRSQGRIQNFADGHKACLSEYGSAFVFAAPLNRNDAIQIDFARLLAETERGSDISRVWLNMTDGGYEDNRPGAGDGRHFRKNLPFVNWLNAYPGEEPINVCAYKSTTAAGQNNPWRTASCTNFAAHYACTDGGSWKVATSKGALVNGSLQVVPQVGEDYWSYERGNTQCKSQFGEQYYFSAPVTAAEESALDAAIRTTNAQVKNTWINYYYVNAISTANNRWFADRLKLGIWQKPQFRNLNNSDCALLHPDGSWTDAICTSQYAYACFNGAWSITGLSGRWDAGYAACDNQNASLFAVPRTPDEMNELLGQLGGQPVWVNMTDTALESQWIANRLRFAWWRTNEPSNLGNRDCARIATDGEWYAGRCSIEHAPFACRTVTSGGNIEWSVTTGTGIWSEGFSVCAREFPGSEFFAPQGYGSHSATMDQATLAAVVASAGRDAWINLSDQEVEGNWRAYQVYSDWGVSSLLDQNNDCAYLDRVTAGTGTWYADVCKYTSATPVSRGYACTNGYEWRLVETAADSSLRWSEGFTACQTLGSGWRYAAPTDAVQNAKLKLAMELAGIAQIWINAQDRTDEGNWQINGPETNFAPVADTTLTALVVNENTSNIQLHAVLDDDEEVGVASATWSLVADSRFVNVADSDVVITANTLVAGAAGSATLTARYNSPVLLQHDAILTFKITATDIPPGTALAATSETFVTVRVKAPRIAAWDFNDATRPQRDVTGNGHDAFNTAAVPMPPVVNGALSLSASSVMVVPGIQASPANGLVIPAAEYSVAFRMSVENAAAGAWRGVLQKGDSGSDRQPAIFLFPDSESLHATNSTNQNFNRSANAMNIPFQQWLNVVYSKRSDGLDIYLDGDLAASYDFAPGEASLINNGSFYVGNIPGAAESFTGLIDDIQIFNRVLSAAEREVVLPPPPLGVVQFAAAGAQVDEDSGSHVITLDRSRGSKAPLTVYVDFNAALSTATQGTQADMLNPLHPADFAFPVSYVSGTGVPVSWPADTRGPQSFTLTLDSADDELREGTELARFTLASLSGATAGLNATYTLRLNDVTPNPYGNFSVFGPDPAVVLENDAATKQICIVRESGALGEVTVNYSIGGSAVAGESVAEGDFEYLPSGIVPAAVSGSVTFADGDSTDQCFDIRVFNNPAIGTADRNISVTLTGLNHAPGLDPLLTAQNQAQLIIRDYSPGTFAFASSTLTCREPNTSAAVPEELRPAAGAVCEIAVVRSDVGLYAPEAQLNLIKLSHVPNDIPLDDVSFNTVLSWPEKAPGSPSEDVQIVTFTILNDGVQERDEVLTLQLQATNGDGHDEIITQGNLQLTVIDVTDPALVTASISGAPASGLLDVDEGGSVVVNVTRSFNNDTEFTVAYSLSATSLGGMGLNDILGLQLNGSNVPTSGTMVFERNTGSNKVFSVNTINTVEPGDNRIVTMRLDQVNPDRIAGLGDRANANKDTQNFTEVAFRIRNTRDSWVNALGSIQVTRADGQAAVAVPTWSSGTAATVIEHRTKARHQIAQHGFMDITIPINAYSGLYDIEDTALSYSISFDNGAGGSSVNGMDLLDLLRTGSNAAMSNSGSWSLDPSGTSFTFRLQMPYVTAQTGDIRMNISMTGNQSGLNQTASYRFRVAPVWQQITVTNNECLYRDGSNIYWQYGTAGGGNCNSGTTNNQLFDYNLYTEQLRNFGAGVAQCVWTDNSGSNRVYLTACNASAQNQKWYWTDGTTIYNRAYEPKLCGAIFGNLILQNSCSWDTTGWR